MVFILFCLAVMMETSEDDKHLVVDSMNVSVPIKNIIFYVRQKQPSAYIEIYVDCVREGSIAMKKSFRDVAEEEFYESPIEVVINQIINFPHKSACLAIKFCIFCFLTEKVVFVKKNSRY